MTEIDSDPYLHSDVEDVEDVAVEQPAKKKKKAYS